MIVQVPNLLPGRQPTSDVLTLIAGLRPQRTQSTLQELKSLQQFPCVIPAAGGWAAAERAPQCEF